MKKGHFSGMAVVLATAFLLSATGIIVAADFPESIQLNEPAYAHTKGIITFSHAKHVDEYKAGCGECHHNKDGKVLELKKGDSVQKCIECHKAFNKKNNTKDAPTTCTKCHPKK